VKLCQGLLVASLVGLAAGCGGARNTPTTPPVTEGGKAIASVEIEPKKATLSKGSTLQFRATVRYADGTIADVTDHPNTVWNTSDPSVATVSKTGLVTAVKEGLVDITADYKGATGHERFVVTP
jgi:trimeric autotransporter adhesin